MSEMAMNFRRLHYRGISIRIRPRTIAVCTLLAIAAAACAIVVTSTGKYQMSLSQVVGGLFGSGAPLDIYMVGQIRLPRAVLGLVVGGALGASGSVFQSMLRNPLASPDVIGFTGGANVAAVAVMATGGTGFLIAGGAVAGGLITATFVYLLAMQGNGSGQRTILTGIAIATMCTAITSLLISRASLTNAQSIQLWLIGSLNGASWDTALPAIICIAILIPALCTLNRRLTVLAFGDDIATGLGVALSPTKALLSLVAVCLASVAVAAAGPVAFVALAAPQLARLLTKAPDSNLIPAMFTGALILAASDMIGERLPVPVPVGVVTGAVGGGYLVFLLSRLWRRTRLFHITKRAICLFLINRTCIDASCLPAA